MSEMKSQRQAQEEMSALGYIDRHGNILEPFKLHDYALKNRISAPEMDSILGVPQGTTSMFTIQNGLKTLDGEPWPPSAGTPVPEGVQYGSGFEGTQAPAAPAADPYGPNDPLGPPPETPEQRAARFQDWRDRVRFDPVSQFLAYVNGARQQGFEDAEIEAFTGWDEGVIEHVMADLQQVLQDLVVVPTPKSA